MDDWINMEGEERKYPGLELRRAVQRKAVNMVNWLDREELKESGGVKRILHRSWKNIIRERGECIC